MIDSMATSDMLQLFGIIASLLTSIIAIAVSLVTVRQNSKMIEDSTRPIMSIYFDYSQLGTPISYFVIKNFGASAAIIRTLTYNDSVKNIPSSYSNPPAIFDGLVGNTIAPGQKFLVPFKHFEYPGGNAVFEVTYTPTFKTWKKYSDRFEIEVSNYGKLAKPRISSNEPKSVSYTLQEIAERLM